MKTLLILTDFSPPATHAALYACNIAEQWGIEKIVLYHSYNKRYATDIIVVDDLLVPVPDDLKDIKDNALKELDDLKSQMLSKLSSKVEIKPLINNLPLIKGVREIFNSHSIDLVIAGLYGSHAKEKNIVGRNAMALIGEQVFPVMLVPETAVIGKISQIMFACDLRYISEQTPFDQLTNIVQTANANLHVVNVDYEETGLVNLMETETLLHEKFKNLNTQFHYLRSKEVILSLSEYSTENKIDVLIAVPRKLGFLQRIFHDSATKKIAIHTTVPLIVLHNN